MDDFSDYSYLVPTPLHIVDRRTQPSWQVKRGRRRFHNILFIAGGSGSAWINGAKHRLAPGMLVYHPEEQEFGYETTPDNPLHCMGGNFSLAVLKPCPGGGCQAYNVTDLRLASITSPSTPERLYRLFAELAVAWGRRTANGSLAARSLFLQILEELRFSGNPELSKHRPGIEQAARFMESSFQQKLSLADLAGHCGLTPSYFGQLFRQHMGMTPLEYLNHLRIEEAVKKIAEGYSLNDASALAGFNDPFYFSRMFKKKKGICPSEYVKRSMLL